MKIRYGIVISLLAVVLTGCPRAEPNKKVAILPPLEVKSSNLLPLPDGDIDGFNLNDIKYGALNLKVSYAQAAVYQIDLAMLYLYATEERKKCIRNQLVLRLNHNIRRVRFDIEKNDAGNFYAKSAVWTQKENGPYTSMVDDLQHSCPI